VLAACGSVLESGKPARQVYLLHTPKAPSGSAQAETPASLILSVRAVPGLDTDLVQVLGNDARLVPVANAHWADNAPEVFTSITRRYLSDTRSFTSVHVGTLARPDEWLLELELQAFYGTQDAAGVTDSVVLKMEGTLRCNGGQHVLQVEKETGASGDSLASLVAAHQRVLDAALPELTALILQPCATPAAG
jgi:uncharacterized lipoprotein YmbA